MATLVYAADPGAIPTTCRSRVFIGTAMYAAAVDVFKEIGGVLAMPSVSYKRETVIVNEYGSQVRRPVKAGFEFSPISVECVDMPDDAGQSYMTLIMANDDVYNFKILTSINKNIDFQCLVTKCDHTQSNGVWMRSFEIVPVSLPVVS